MEQRTLLIIDDSADDRATIARRLGRDTNFEYRVVETAGIAAALAQIDEVKPDCVVLNHLLPDGTALDFLRAVTDESGRLRFPVVVHTGTGDPKDAVALLKAGVQDYLIKSDAAEDSIRLAVNNAIYKTRTDQRIDAQGEELERLYAAARESNETLRAVNAAKDNFLAMLSHELRTPLTPVLSLVSSTLNGTALTPDLRQTFVMIQRNVELEAHLIDDLLDLTQITSGHLKIEKKPVDLQRCIQAALEVCQHGFDEKRITVRTELGATETTVPGDYARLNQMLWNVLKNAAKFSRPNSHVTITTRNEPGHVIVEIRDDGLGIESERLATIFGAFSPIQPQPTRTGLGLGLAITRAIVDGHGGEIHAHSEGRERGTVFVISLPTAAVAAPKAAARPRLATSAARGRTVLIVEDHEDTRNSLCRALRQRGFGVTTAGSVAAACERFAAAPADLVVCDIGLPDGTGWELMEKLRAHGPVRAIAVSGYGMEHDVEKSREAGFAAHLTKPIDFPRLERVILENLAPARG